MVAALVIQSITVYHTPPLPAQCQFFKINVQTRIKMHQMFTEKIFKIVWHLFLSYRTLQYRLFYLLCRNLELQKISKLYHDYSSVGWMTTKSCQKSLIQFATKGHSKTMWINFCPILTTYLPYRGLSWTFGALPSLCPRGHRKKLTTLPLTYVNLTIYIYFNSF